MLQVKYVHFSPRCRKSHVKEQIQYEVTCFSPFLATRCLHVTYDFRVYSQLSLPICRLSAYTLLRTTTELSLGTVSNESLGGLSWDNGPNFTISLRNSIKHFVGCSVRMITLYLVNESSRLTNKSRFKARGMQ